jgi:hypothetical protein
LLSGHLHLPAGHVGKLDLVALLQPKRLKHGGGKAHGKAIPSSGDLYIHSEIKKLR